MWQLYPKEESRERVVISDARIGKLVHLRGVRARIAVIPADRIEFARVVDFIGGVNTLIQKFNFVKISLRQGR